MPHIHIHLHRKTRDSGEGPKHAPAGSPKGGQFVSGSGGSASGGAKAKHTPMAQSNRNATAQGLKEARHVMKQKQLTTLKSSNQEQAESDIAEAKKRIAAKKNAPGQPKAQDPGQAKHEARLREIQNKLDRKQIAAANAGQPMSRQQAAMKR